MSSQKKKIDHLIEVKSELSRKYFHMAGLAKSATKRKKLRNRAQDLHRQAERLRNL